MAETLKIVFLDIDGTLVNKGLIIPSAREAVEQLKRTGIEVALCTGRSPLHTRAVMKDLGIQQCIFFNGGMVEREGVTLYGQPLESDVVARMVTYFTESNTPLILHTNREAISLAAIPPHLRDLLDDYGYPPIQQYTMEQWNDAEPEIYQANIFCTRDWDTRIQNLFPECLLYRWEENGADLQKRGADKAQGASVLLKHLGISPREAVHIGDGGNDVGMFGLVGTSVAMGNAHEDVKQHAKHITSHCEDGGVAKALEQLGLI